MNTDVKRYLNEIKYLLPLFQRKEKEYFKRTKNIIFKETKNIPNITYDDCVYRYGTPENVVKTYIDELDTDIIMKKLHKNSEKNIVLLIFMIIMYLIYRLIKLFYK
ncbi:MAG: DUF6120 family protein [Thomasclavelia sp.]|uniref:DUF6120 family protein n=1 Tax=Thomasclavelia sp. TaxID=3025757 RepID=UPI0039A0C777